MKVTAKIPATAKVASKPGVVLIVVVDLVVLVGSVAGVVLVVVVVDSVASWSGADELLVVAVDLAASGLGVVLVAVLADLATSLVTGSSSHCTIPLTPSSGFVLPAPLPILGLR